MESISLKFYLNKNKTQGDKTKIYGRLIINRNKAEFYTSFAVKPDKWDNIKQAPIGDFSLKQELLELQNKIYKIRRSFIDKDIIPTAKNIVDVLKNKKSKLDNIKIFDFYKACIKEMVDKNELSKSTIKHYQGTFKILENFNNIKRGRNIPIAEINYQYIKEFDYYLTVNYKSPLGEKLERNTISKHHGRLRAIINKAICDDLLTLNPYTKFTLKYTKTNVEYLTQDELEKIENANLGGNISLEKTRDIFLFSCNTAVRFQDAQDLTMSSIKKLNNDEKYLELIMGKTSERVAVPLTQQAISIINKYSEHGDRLVKDKILPQISNQKFNTYIKVIADMAGLKKSISHHVARHTFATIALNNGIPLVVVQKVLGHTSIKTTEIYAKLLKQTLFEEMKKMN